MLAASIWGGIPDTLGFIIHIVPKKSGDQKMKSQSIISFWNVLNLLDTEQFYSMIYRKLH